MRSILALVMVAGSVAGAGDGVVVRLGDPQPQRWLGYGDTRFFSIDNAGVAYGADIELFRDPVVLPVRGDDAGITVIPSSSGYSLGGGVARVTASGRFLLSATGFQYEPDVCPQGEGFGFSTSRDLLFDIGTGDITFFTPLCPSFTALELSNDGRVVVGDEDDFSGPTRTQQAAVWRDGLISRLSLPAHATRGDAAASRAVDVSADGTVIAGSSVWNASNGSPPEVGVVLWIDGTPSLLPEFDIDGDAASSTAYALSSDGASVLGASWTYSPSLDAGGWLESALVHWIYRDGQFHSLGTVPGDEFVGGLASNGEIAFGSTSLDWIDPNRRGLVWTSVSGLVGALDYLAGLGVDLTGERIFRVDAMSESGDWMLVTLRVDDEHEQYARIRVPCSPADLTADRAIALDDLLAYAERFSDGNALADLNGDGLLDLADIVRYLGLFADGCPG